MLLTSKFRRIRTLNYYSVLHENRVNMELTAIKRRCIGNSRNVAIGSSVATGSVSFSLVSKIILPNNVPKALGLLGDRGTGRVVQFYTSGGELVNTVYTTPVVLNSLKVLRKGETAYFPKCRSELAKTRLRGSFIMASGGVVATGNTKTSLLFKTTVITCFGRKAKRGLLHRIRRV